MSWKRVIRMKKCCLMLLAFILMLAMTACSGDQKTANSEITKADQQKSSETDVSEKIEVHLKNSEESSMDTINEVQGKTLIVCFSHTGTTEAMAKEIQALTCADVFEITPEVPYPDEHNNLLEIAKDEQGKGARPLFSGEIENVGEYSTIFLGYPIWHGTSPMIMFTFLDDYDLTGKTIIPFCTSGGSGISRSIDDIRGACVGSMVLDGLGLTGSLDYDSKDAVGEWLGNLGFQDIGDGIGSSKGSNENINVQIGDRFFTAVLVEKASTKAMKELLADGPITIDMRDYGNMEKVGELSTSLPTNDEQITAGPGSLILYQGSSFVIYYESNSWSLTRLGRINDVTKEELKEVLGNGNITVTLSL